MKIVGLLLAALAFPFAGAVCLVSGFFSVVFWYESLRGPGSTFAAGFSVLFLFTLWGTVKLYQLARRLESI